MSQLFIMSFGEIVYILTYKGFKKCDDYVQMREKITRGF